MPIAIAPLNKEFKIVKILVDEKTKRHLESLGVIVNAVVRVISRSGGNIIFAVKNGRLAINKDVANKILVG